MSDFPPYPEDVIAKLMASELRNIRMSVLYLKDITGQETAEVVAEIIEYLKELK